MELPHARSMAAASSPYAASYESTAAQQSVAGFAPRLFQPPVPRPSPQGPQRRVPATASAEGVQVNGRPFPPACCGACPALANVALHRALPGCRPRRRGRRGLRGGPPAPGGRRGRRRGVKSALNFLSAGSTLLSSLHTYVPPLLAEWGSRIRPRLWSGGPCLAHHACLDCSCP
jgi:hypothetical protein